MHNGLTIPDLETLVESQLWEKAREQAIWDALQLLSVNPLTFFSVPFDVRWELSDRLGRVSAYLWRELDRVPQKQYPEPNWQALEDSRDPANEPIWSYGDEQC